MPIPSIPSLPAGSGAAARTAARSIVRVGTSAATREELGASSKTGTAKETNNGRNQPPEKTMQLSEAGIVPAAGLDLG